MTAAVARIGSGFTNIPGAGRCEVFCEVRIAPESSAVLPPGSPTFQTRRVVETPRGERYATPWTDHDVVAK